MTKQQLIDVMATSRINGFVWNRSATMAIVVHHSEVAALKQLMVEFFPLGMKAEIIPVDKQFLGQMIVDGDDWFSQPWNKTYPIAEQLKLEETK